MNGTACTSDSSNAPSGSYKPTVLKNDSCACVVVHEEINTTTIRVDFKIVNGRDERAIATAAVVQSTVSGALLSVDIILSVNGVSTFADLPNPGGLVSMMMVSIVLLVTAAAAAATQCRLCKLGETTTSIGGASCERW